jgi:hypothetical protein
MSQAPAAAEGHTWNSALQAGLVTVRSAISGPAAGVATSPAAVRRLPLSSRRPNAHEESVKISAAGAEIAAATWHP